MRTKKIIILLMLISLAANFCYCQTSKNETTIDKYRAVNWGLDEGLSKGDVSAMIKDANGFLWVGTSFGLNRFDGGGFKKYFADKTKKNKTIISNETEGLIEDSLHNIWIGTVKGLSCYDIKADSFRNISSNLARDEIVPFWATKDEVFCWNFSEHELTAYNIQSLAKRTLTKITPADTVGFGVSTQYTIYDAGSNSVWMEKGYRGTGGGLLQVSVADGKRKEFNWPCYKKIPNHSHWSEGMRYDRNRNSIWISSPDGLMEFTLNDKKFHHIDALNEFENLPDFHQWAGIDFDRDGRIWMATYPKGIVIYDPANNSVSIPFPDDSVQQKKVSDENLMLYCDKDGMVWSGFWSQKGVYQVIPFSPAAKHYVGDAHQVNVLTNNLVSNFRNADHGTLWMGSNDGIKVFDPHTGFLNLLTEKDLPGIKGGGFLFPINVDTIGKKAWILGDGFYEMDLNTRKCSLVLYEDSNGNKLPLSSILAHHPDNWWIIDYKNECIIGADLPDHQEILVVNGDSPVTRKVLSFPGEPIDLFSICTNDNNLIFLKRPNAVTNLTYSFHNNNWMRVSTPLDSIQWSGIFYNKRDQTYWIIAETQLIHYDKNFRLIYTYTDEDGMPGVQIHGLTPDNRGNIWFNTDRSIFQLNTKTGTITMLAEKDGYLMQNISAFRGTKDNDGDIYINADNDAGFYRISPEKYVFSASSVYLESLKINQQPFPLSTGINNAGELSLKYFENNIVIEAGVIDYYSKGKGHIRYKLEQERKQTEWQYAPAYYTIRYEGLPPGEYTLHIQASNASNEFNGPEKILTITITPPFWQTWWFRTLAIIVLIAVVYATVQYRSRNLKKQNIALEEKVMHRTKELKHSLEDLRSTQAQLIQSEKMASLGELTAGIAHEIQNPLNFVNNFSEVNKELIEELESELKNNNNDEAILIAKDLKENEQKINHHGKRADAIVKGMLEHSKTSTGKKEPTDINKLADEYLRLAYHGMRAKDKSFNSDIKTEFDESIEKINIVSQDIGRVLLNLFNNAFYTVNEKKKSADEDYQPIVTVQTKKLNDKIEISVSDNGNGIPQNIIDKIFQPFFTTKPTGQGTGLGLSLSYDIIKAHHGEIKVETKEGEGSKFTIRLAM